MIVKTVGEHVAQQGAASAGSGRPPTLREIAELTGVHVSTVSRILRQSTPPDGWSETAQRVRQTAQDLGYQRNDWAASLRTRRTNVLGAVMPRLTDGVIATMFSGVQDAAEEAGYSVLLSSPPDTPEGIRRAAGFVASRNVDGLIMSSVHRPGADFVSSISTYGTPLLLLSRHADSGLPAVTSDDREGGRLAARHLLELGHRRFGIVAGPDHASTAHDRVEGFLDGIREGGGAVADIAVEPSAFEVDGGVAAAHALLAQNPRPTAIFSVNDTAAIGALGVARDLGLTVPIDLSIVGFNDIPIAAQLPIALTTIRTQAHAMGVSAVEQLLHLIAGRTPTSVTLPVELVPRQTTGPARD